MTAHLHQVMAVLQEPVGRALQVSLHGGSPGYHFGVGPHVPLPVLRVPEARHAPLGQVLPEVPGYLFPGLESDHAATDVLERQGAVHVLRPAPYYLGDIVQPQEGVLGQNLGGLLVDGTETGHQFNVYRWPVNGLIDLHEQGS